MSSVAVEMAGQTFGWLTVIERAEREGPHAYWVCRCDCGTVKEIAGRVLRRGGTKSCGCRKAALVAAAQTTHGQSRTLLYKRYWGMVDRCTKPTHPGYPRYGGRGITVCGRWLESFANFYADVAAGFSPELELDRIDNDGNYEPGNVRWVTSSQNGRNSSNARILEYGGERLALSDWADRLGIRSGVIKARLRNGWSVERTLTEPVRKHRS